MAKQVRETTKQFYAAVRAEYERLISIKEFGAQKYSDEYIRKKLATKFFRSQKTIEDIIFYRV